MKVALLHDALSADARADERDVLDQVEAVIAALDKLGHKHYTRSLQPDLDRSIGDMRGLRPDVVFNLVESVAGSGRGIDMVPERLQRFGLCYTGAGPAATACAASKLLTKAKLAASGMPTPWSASAQQLRDGIAVPHGQYIVKSVWEHGSLGLESDCVVMADNAPVLLEAVEARLGRLGGEAFAEAFVPGREFNLAMLAKGGDVQHLPAAEIRFDRGLAATARIVGYQAKWSPGSEQDEGTPRAFDVAADDRPLVAQMQDLARSVWRTFGLAGYARVDLRVDEQGAPWIIDVNTNPCLSPGAGYAAALDHAGIEFSAAIERLLFAALLRRT